MDRWRFDNLFVSANLVAMNFSISNTTAIIFCILSFMILANIEIILFKLYIKEAYPFRAIYDYDIRNFLINILYGYHLEQQVYTLTKSA